MRKGEFYTVNVSRCVTVNKKAADWAASLRRVRGYLSYTSLSPFSACAIVV